MNRAQKRAANAAGRGQTLSVMQMLVAAVHKRAGVLDERLGAIGPRVGADVILDLLGSAGERFGVAMHTGNGRHALDAAAEAVLLAMHVHDVARAQADIAARAGERARAVEAGQVTRSATTVADQLIAAGAATVAVE